jgi:hypothetical protein
MAQSDILQRQINTLADRNVTLTKDALRADEEAGRYQEAAQRRADQASRATNSASASSHLRAAQADEKRAISAAKKAADIRSKIATNNKQITSLTSRVRSAEEQERKSLARTLQQGQRKEVAHARAVRRLAAEAKRDWDYLSSREGLRVLYLTANPYSVDRHFTSPEGEQIEESHWLHTEVEVREVQAAIRGSTFRGRIRVEHRPAATFDILLDGLNDLRPQIVHFSGHAGGGELAFESSEARGTDASVSLATLKKALGSTDERPTLVVLNACDSLRDAEQLLEVVDVVIGMTSKIDDSSAIIFAKRFYAALASGQSIIHSLGQAKAAMEVTAMEDAELPVHIFRNEEVLTNRILIED